MNSFWCLVGFEYKKIIKRKSFIFAVVTMLFMATFCMVGNVLNSLEYEKEEREILHSVAGYIDSEMIADVILKNVEAREKIDENGYYEDDIYNNNIRPYNELRSDLAFLLSPITAFNFENFNRLNNADGIDYYALRTKHLEDKMKVLDLPQKEVEKTLALNESLKTPFYQDYYFGYLNFLTMMSTSAVFILLALSMCIAPIFADEYQKKTDSIILTTRHGKEKLIYAKIFTAVTLSLLLTISSLAIALVTTFSVLSSTGGNVSFQIFGTFNVYPLTMAKAVLIFCAVIICVALLISALCMMLSAKTSSFATITAIMLLLVGTLFVSIPFENLRTINYFLPAKMMDSTYVFSERLVSVFGMYLKPYIFIPIVCFVLSAILIPLAYKTFKNHQVG